MKDKKTYKKIWKMVWPSLKLFRWLIPFLFLSSIVLGLLSFAGPYLFGKIIDLFVSLAQSGNVTDVNFGKFLPFLLFWLFVQIFSTVIGAFHSYGSWWIANETYGKFLTSFFKRVLYLDLRRFEDESSGALLHRFDAVWTALFNVVSMFFESIITSFFTFFLIIGVGIFVDWRMTLISLVAVPFVIGLGIFNYKFASKGQDKVSVGWELVSGKIGDSFTNIATVKSFSKETKRILEVARQYTKTLKQQNKVNKIWAGAYAGYQGVYSLGRVLIIFGGLWLIFQGKTTIGTVIMFSYLSYNLFFSLQRILDSFPQVLKSVSQLKRAALLWYETPKIKEHENAISIKKIKGEVEFKNVSYSYKKGSEVLKNISFILPAGQAYALVGESGAGKSTLAKMMLRFHDPKNGVILFDGIDIKNITLKSLRNNVGFVMQENLLFNDTIYNNILLAKPKASKEDIFEAAKRAQAYDFIKAMPKGFETLVGERGVKLSGGEKQRIALARIFLEDPAILVLDEATSALDSKTEHSLQKALKEVMKGRTSIVIAHRLSTVMEADKILVMDKGRIVDIGKHNELIKKDSLYKEYWELQAGGYV